MDEILIKDIGFKPLDDEELIKIFKTEYYIRNRRKAIKRIIVILELLIFFILAIIDPKLDKVLIPVTIDIIALTIEYFIWMISKYKKIIKHFDIDYFFKSSTILEETVLVSIVGSKIPYSLYVSNICLTLLYELFVLYSTKKNAIW